MRFLSALLLSILWTSIAAAGPTITSPEANSIINGTVTIICTESVVSGSWVNILIDGTQVLSSSTQTGTYAWTTSGLSGNHTIGCQGYYWSGGAVLDGTVSETVTVGPTPTPTPTPSPTPSPTVLRPHGWVNAGKVGYSGCCTPAPVSLAAGATVTFLYAMPASMDINLGIFSDMQAMVCNLGTSDTKISYMIGTDCSNDATGNYPLLPYFGANHPIYQNIPVKAGTCFPIHITRLDTATQTYSVPLPPIAMLTALGTCPTVYPVPQFSLSDMGSAPVTYQLDAEQWGVPLTEHLTSSPPWD